VCNSKTVAKHLAGDVRCASSFIPAQQLEDIVWNDLCTALKHPESIDQAMQRMQDGEWLPQELQARTALLSQAQKSLQQQLERLTQACLNNVIQLEEYQWRRSQLESQEQALIVQQQQLVLQAQQKLEIAKLAQGIEEFCQRASAALSQANFEQKRKLVELLIDRVIVTGDEVEIRYVIPTPARGETTHFCHLRLDYLAPLNYSALATNRRV
jgi:site-specific DNA recombinase